MPNGTIVVRVPRETHAAILAAAAEAGVSMNWWLRSLVEQQLHTARIGALPPDGRLRRSDLSEGLLDEPARQTPPAVEARAIAADYRELARLIAAEILQTPCRFEPSEDGGRFLENAQQAAVEPVEEEPDLQQAAEEERHAMRELRQALSRP